MKEAETSSVKDTNQLLSNGTLHMQQQQETQTIVHSIHILFLTLIFSPSLQPPSVSCIKYLSDIDFDSLYIDYYFTVCFQKICCKQTKKAFIMHVYFQLILNRHEWNIYKLYNVQKYIFSQMFKCNVVLSCFSNLQTFFVKWHYPKKI